MPALRSRVSRSFRLRSPRNTPLPSVTNDLLEATGFQARTAHQEDVPYARPRPAQRFPTPRAVTSRNGRLGSARAADLRLGAPSRQRLGGVRAESCQVVLQVTAAKPLAGFLVRSRSRGDLAGGPGRISD
jgi:hypothetical protein